MNSKIHSNFWIFSIRFLKVPSGFWFSWFRSVSDSRNFFSTKDSENQILKIQQNVIQKVLIFNFYSVSTSWIFLIHFFLFRSKYSQRIQILKRTKNQNLPILFFVFNDWFSVNGKSAFHFQFQFCYLNRNSNSRFQFLWMGKSNSQRLAYFFQFHSIFRTWKTSLSTFNFVSWILVLLFSWNSDVTTNLNSKCW